jgi:hypothetical protein
MRREERKKYFNALSLLLHAAEECSEREVRRKVHMQNNYSVLCAAQNSSPNFGAQLSHDQCREASEEEK